MFDGRPYIESGFSSCCILEENDDMAAILVFGMTAACSYNQNGLFVQPYEFVVGQPVSQVGVKKISDSANGLFSGQSGVKPPPALSTAVIGMKPGGKVGS